MNYILIEDFNRGHYCIRSENQEQWMEMATILDKHGFLWNSRDSLLESTKRGIVEIHVEDGDKKVMYVNRHGWYQCNGYCDYCLDVKTFTELYKTNLVSQYKRVTL